MCGALRTAVIARVSCSSSNANGGVGSTGCSGRANDSEELMMEMQARLGMKTLYRPIRTASAGTFFIKDD